MISCYAILSGKIIPLTNKSTQISVGQSLEVIGWGITSEGGNACRDLLKANVPCVLNSTCNEPASYNGRIGWGMMCVPGGARAASLLAYVTAVARWC